MSSRNPSFPSSSQSSSTARSRAARDRSSAQASARLAAQARTSSGRARFLSRSSCVSRSVAIQLSPGLPARDEALHLAPVVLLDLRLVAREVAKQGEHQERVDVEEREAERQSLRR